MSALLIGCFAPDFAYFFFLGPRGLAAHTLWGMFVIDLPLSLVALWLFHSFVKQPSLMLLPRGFRARLGPREGGFTFWPAPRLALIVISILIGTATHILWDSFTHPFYWPYRHWGFLSKVVHVPVEGNVPMFKALQNGSTVIGLVIVALWIWSWYRATEPVRFPVEEPYTRAQIRVIRIAVPAAALIGGLIVACKNVVGPDVDIRFMVHFGLITTITATTLFWFGLLICGVTFRRLVTVKQPSPH